MGVTASQPPDEPPGVGSPAGPGAVERHDLATGREPGGADRPRRHPLLDGETVGEDPVPVSRQHVVGRRAHRPLLQVDEQRSAPHDGTSFEPVLADLTVLPGVPTRVAARRILRSRAIPVERQIEDRVLRPVRDSEVAEDVVHARHLVEVHGGRVRHHLPVADAVDLMAEPRGRVVGVPVEGEVALDKDLVGVEGLRGQVLPDLPEQHVEVAVSPEVVAGQLVPEDLPECGPEVAQLVRALEGDVEVEVALDPRGQVCELAQLHADVGRRVRHRRLREQQPVDVGLASHARDHERHVRRALAEVGDDQSDRRPGHRRNVTTRRVPWTPVGQRMGLLPIAGPRVTRR